MSAIDFAGILRWQLHISLSVNPKVGSWGWLLRERESSTVPMLLLTGQKKGSSKEQTEQRGLDTQFSLCSQSPSWKDDFYTYNILPLRFTNALLPLEPLEPHLSILQTGSVITDSMSDCVFGENRIPRHISCGIWVALLLSKFESLSLSELWPPKGLGHTLLYHSTWLMSERLHNMETQQTKRPWLTACPWVHISIYTGSSPILRNGLQSVSHAREGGERGNAACSCHSDDEGPLGSLSFPWNMDRRDWKALSKHSFCFRKTLIPHSDHIIIADELRTVKVANRAYWDKAETIAGEFMACVTREATFKWVAGSSFPLIISNLPPYYVGGYL